MTFLNFEIVKDDECAVGADKSRKARINEKALWVMLSLVDGVGYKTFNGILKKIQARKLSLQEFIFDLRHEDYETHFHLKFKSVLSLMHTRENVGHVINIMKEMERNHVHVINLSNNQYPSRVEDTLRENAPPIFYAWGNLSLLNKRSIAVVGSRDAGDTHLKTARALAKELSRAGYSIISGYAKGIDTESHLGALEAGGSTVMVLSYGIGEFKLKRSFHNDIEDTQERMLVISEFPPTQKWSVHAAMTRNKTVCVLSDAVIVVTASADGGTMDTARTALKMGKPLFAAHYDAASLNSDGNRLLLNEGALPLKVAFEHDAVTVNVNDIEQLLSAGVSHKEKQISLFA